MNLIFRNSPGLGGIAFVPRGDTLVVNGVSYDLSFVEEGCWLEREAFRDPVTGKIPGWVGPPITRAGGELQVEVHRDPEAAEPLAPATEVPGAIDRATYIPAADRLARARAQSQADINRFLEGEADRLAGADVYTRFERDTFWLQQMEAKALLAGSMTLEQSTLVVPLANTKKAAVPVVAQKIIDKAAGMTKLAKAVIVCRGVMESGLAAATTEDEAYRVIGAVKSAWAQALGGK